MSLLSTFTCLNEYFQFQSAISAEDHDQISDFCPDYDQEWECDKQQMGKDYLLEMKQQIGNYIFHEHCSSDNMKIPYKHGELCIGIS